MTVEIIIAIHKPCAIPMELASDGAYIPLFVGASSSKPLFIKGNEVIRPEGEVPSGFSPMKRDDSGVNISEKNQGFSELTGLYWLYKNSSAEALGLVHYRRYFKGLSKDRLEKLLEAHDAIVPKKRRYYIETLYSHYANTLDRSHLDEALSIIRERHPEYEKAAVEVYGRTWGYMFNMLVMKRDFFREYCDFLFDILFELEKRPLPGQNGSAFERRLYGRVSEILFNVWLAKQKELSVFEFPVKSAERVNWFKKGTAFLSAKFFKKKYKESF